jgi:hypothetical protein
MMARVRFLLVSSLVGCFSPSRSLVSEALPDEVDDTALIFTNESGGVVEATGLVLRDHDEPIGVELPDAIERAAFVHLVGYRGEDLIAAGLTEENRTMAIGIATDDEPALPAPAWYATSRVFEAKGTLERRSDPPYLTAPWLAPCPKLVNGTSTLVDSGCHELYCALRAEQSGCTFTVRTTELFCSPAELEGRIDGSDQLAVPGCEPRTPNPGASAAIECTGIRSFPCRVEIYADSDEPRFESIERQLYTELEPAPGQGGRSVVVTGGYLFGLEVFDDRIVVSSDDGRVAWAGECAVDAPGRFHFLDPDTLEPIGTTTSPPCVRDMVRIPNTNEFFAAYGAETVHRLGRFDSNGRLLESAPIPDAIDRADIPFALLLHQLSDRVSIAVENGSDVDYHVYRRAPLELEWSSDHFSEMTSHQERGEKVLAILSRVSDRIHLVDIAQPPADTTSPFYPSNAGSPIEFRVICEDVQIRPERQLFLPREGWLLASRGTNTGLVAQLSLDATDCHVVRYFEARSEVFEIALWPNDPNLVLAGVRHVDDDRAFLALMNRSEGRFLTGSLEIGRGAIDDIRFDAAAHAYLLLPWSATVVRARFR